MYKIYTKKSGMTNCYIHKIWMIMRLTTVLLIATLMQVSAAGFAQRITLKVNKVALEEVLLNLRDQSGYDFVFERGDFKGLSPINMSVRNVSLDDAINSALSGQPLTYNIEGKVVVIKKQHSSILDGIINAFASIDVKGIVVDAEGTPLSGATVTIKGTNRSVITNKSGFFLLTNVDEKAVLLISYLGFETQEISAKINLSTIQLVQSSGKLDEVVVAVSTGYQTVPKERAAGSFSVIDKGTLEKRNIYNITDYLQGRVTGLLTSASNVITIRGQSTFSAGQGALIVVDGFPINYNVDAINPNDIESITVLKDASAASIWGARAANGVIVIQTKRNKASKKALDISLNSSVSVSAKPDLSKLPFASATSFLEYEKFKVDNHLVSAANTIPRPAYTEGLDAYLYHPATAGGLVEPLKNNNVYNEFGDLFMQAAVRQQYGLSISGKGDKGFFRGSFNYDDVQTNFKGTGNTRFIADLFQKTDITSKLSLELGLNFASVNSKTNGLLLTDLSNLAPYQKILDGAGNYVPQPVSYNQADKDALVESGFPYSWSYNLKQEADNKNNTAINRTLIATAGISYKFTNSLALTSNYKYENTGVNSTRLQNEETYFVRNLVNFSTRSTSNVITSGVPKGEIFNKSEGTGQTHLWRNQLLYNGPIFNNDHQLTAIAGFEVQQVSYSGSGIQKYGYDPQTLQFTNVNYNIPYLNFGNYNSFITDASYFNENLNRYVSFYTNAGYTYLDKYSINGSARQDKTNLFGASDKYKNVLLWSTGLSWQAHKESFLKSGPFSSLIFRASYGINGNVDRSTSPFLIANVSIDATSNQPYAYVTNPENPLLRWEKTAVTNVGVDFVTLKGRLSGTVEYYNRKSTDLLGNSTVNDTYGFSSAYINYASMNNRGVEVHLAAQLLKGDFSINTMINYSYNKNKVTKVDFPQKTAGSFLQTTPQESLPLNYLYSYRWAGLSANGSPRIYNGKNEIIDYNIEMTDPLALVYQGTTVAPHYGGLFTDFGYKDLTLTAGFTYQAGHKFRAPVIQYGQFYYASTGNALSIDWNNRWKQPGDENNTNIPAMPVSATGLTLYDQESKYADINVKDASVVRFQELILNYKLPKGIFGTSIAQVINVGVQVRNLGVYKFNMAKLDPDYFTVDQNNIRFSPPTEYTFMLKANF